MPEEIQTFGFPAATLCLIGESVIEPLTNILNDANVDSETKQLFTLILNEINK